LVADNRRDRAALQKTLSDGRKLAFSDLLQHLSRVELQQMCRALRQEDRGRSKQELIDRILPLPVRRGTRKSPSDARKPVSRRPGASAAKPRKAVRAKAAGASGSALVSEPEGRSGEAPESPGPISSTPTAR
jgi:hypothetical protein